MSKDKISDYSATANSNTDIGGINIDEGCAPSGINDAIRTLMKQLKDWQSGSQDVYIHPAGSASVPSITATGDTNTGLFFPAADTVGIATGGTERARVDSSGNLGLGVTPSAWGTGSSVRALQFNSGSLWNFSSTAVYLGHNYYFNGTNRLYSNTGPVAEYQLYNGTHVWNIAGSGSAGAVVTFTQAMTLDASGNLYLGATSGARGGSTTRQLVKLGTSQSYLEIQSASTSSTDDAILFSDGSTGNYGQVGYNHSADALNFFTAATERARIDSSGNLLVGTTSVFGAGGISIQPSAGAPTVDVKGSATTNGSSVFNVYSTGASAYRFYVGMGGTISATSTTITGISDRRLKENIRDLDDGLEKVMALQPRKFDWKEGKGADVKNARGFIAQEFEQVFPDLIEQWKDEPPEGEEPYKAVRADLIPTLVKAIQEQQAIITDLTNRITALEGAK